MARDEQRASRHRQQEQQQQEQEQEQEQEGEGEEGQDQEKDVEEGQEEEAVLTTPAVAVVDRRHRRGSTNCTRLAWSETWPPFPASSRTVVTSRPRASAGERSRGSLAKVPIT